MDIAVSSSGRTQVVKLIGPITEAEGDTLRKTFDDILASTFLNVHLDLSSVPIITSTGIGKLIVLFRKLKMSDRTLKIKGIHDNLYTMFTSINLDKMFEVVR